MRPIHLSVMVYYLKHCTGWCTIENSYRKAPEHKWKIVEIGQNCEYDAFMRFLTLNCKNWTFSACQNYLWFSVLWLLSCEVVVYGEILVYNALITSGSQLEIFWQTWEFLSSRHQNSFFVLYSSGFEDKMSLVLWQTCCCCWWQCYSCKMYSRTCGNASISSDCRTDKWYDTHMACFVILQYCKTSYKDHPKI